MELNKGYEIFYPILTRWLKEKGLYTLWYNNIRKYEDKNFNKQRWFKTFKTCYENRHDKIKLLRNLHDIFFNAPFPWDDKLQPYMNGYNIKGEKTWGDLQDSWRNYLHTNIDEIYNKITE